MTQPTVAVLAHPYLFTSLIERVLNAHGGYTVVAPNVVIEDFAPFAPFDVVIASLPVPRWWGRVVMQLPFDFAQPVTVSVGDISVGIDVDPHRPLPALLELLDLVAGDQAQDVTIEALRAASARHHGPPA